MQTRIVQPSIRMLTPDDCQKIHEASLEILRKTGVRVYHAGALALLRKAGALVTDENLVRIPASLVEWAMRQAPSSVALCARGSSRVVAPLYGNNVNFGPGSDCPNYLDPRTGVNRPFEVGDIVDCIRLVDALPEMQFCMSMGIPSELANGSAYRLQFALMLAHTTKPLVFVCDDLADCECIVAMAESAAGGEQELRMNPNLALYSEPTTPLKHSHTATEKLLFMARRGLPIIHSPAPMMGGTAPVTIAGGLALGNAEVLSSLVMHQLERAGAPFIYGVQAHHIDMRTTVALYGTPEYELVRVAQAAMAGYYHLPIWGNAGMSDSPELDEQAAIDAAFSVSVALLTGTHLTHDVGYLEAGLTTSPEMIVLTAEVISSMRRFEQGFALDSEALALDVIDQVGPGGDYIATEHTLHHYREIWRSDLFNRQRRSRWLERGGKSLRTRLKERVIDIYASAPGSELDGNSLAEIEHLLGYPLSSYAKRMDGAS